MSEIPVFLRPILWSNSLTVVTWESKAVKIETGVYGSVSTLAKELETQCAAHEAAIDFALNSDFKVVISSNATFTLSWGDTTLRDIFGFTGNLSGASSYTATYTPQYCWLPTHCPATQDEFMLRHQDRFIGRTSVDGSIAGVKVDGGNLYYRTFVFEFEPNYIVGSIFARNAYDAPRCLDTFLDGVRFQPVDGAGQPAATGCYVYYDYTDAQPTDDMTTSEGVNIYYTSSPDTHTFCHLVPESIERYQASLPVTRDRWNVGFELNTATAPTWTAGN